jgi:hypothetical protein
MGCELNLQLKLPAGAFPSIVLYCTSASPSVSASVSVFVCAWFLAIFSFDGLAMELLTTYLHVLLKEATVTSATPVA